VSAFLARFRPRRLGLRSRITLTFTLGAFALSLLLAATTYGLTRSTLVRQRDTSILRQERSLIKRGDAMLNLVGVDNTDPDRILATVKGLVIPGMVNILLEHYPGLFDYGLGIDLTLAGDIHGGGQLSLDFVHRGLNLGSLMGVPYIRGLYEKGAAQLYMNRGIGITGFPIRLGARPEITLLELARS